MSYGYYDNGPRRGIRPQWVIALVLAAIGVISYLSSYQRNPVTHELQPVGISVAEERALGLQAAPKMAREMGGVASPENDPGAREVAEMGRRLVRRSDAANSPYADNFHFYLLEDPRTINAFALPGGQVFITKGLYDRLTTEAELAGVLGHEIGHVIGRHSSVQMAKGKLGQMLTTAVGVGASDGRDSGRGAYMAAAMANQMLQLHYGRGDESQADQFGLKYMAQAGYDPSAMLGVMKILREADRSGRAPEFLATHPYPETRIKTIKEFLEENYPNGIPADLEQGKPLNRSR